MVFEIANHDQVIEHSRGNKHMPNNPLKNTPTSRRGYDKTTITLKYSCFFSVEKKLREWITKRASARRFFFELAKKKNGTGACDHFFCDNMEVKPAKLPYCCKKELGATLKK